MSKSSKTEILIRAAYDLYCRFEAFLIRHPLHIKADFESFPPLIKIQTHPGFVKKRLETVGSLSRKTSYKIFINID